MIDPNNVPAVARDERLARYIYFRNHVRSRDSSVKADAFMPPFDLQLSVNRHLHSSDEEVWLIGETVAMTTDRLLYGRADVTASRCHEHEVNVVAASVAGNPNHAHVIGWPSDKPAQKLIAQEITAAARFLKKP